MPERDSAAHNAQALDHLTRSQAENGRQAGIHCALVNDLSNSTTPIRYGCVRKKSVPTRPRGSPAETFFRVQPRRRGPTEHAPASIRQMGHDRDPRASHRLIQSRWKMWEHGSSQQGALPSNDWRQTGQSSPPAAACVEHTEVKRTGASDSATCTVFFTAACRGLHMCSTTRPQIPPRKNTTKLFRQVEARIAVKAQ